MRKHLFSNYARLVIQKHVQAFIREKSGVVKGKDLEFLHRMRVASRRVRTALWVFKAHFKTSEYKYFRRQFRIVTRALGQARDLDTHIAFLKQLKKGLKNKSSQEALERFIQISQAKRLSLQESIKTILRKLDQSKVVSKLLQSLNQTAPSSTISLNDVAEYKINQCLIELFEHAPFVDRYQKQNELHRLRIAAKHLRYTLENLNELYDKKLNVYIHHAQLLQKYLGDMRNQLVWKNEFKIMKSPQSDKEFLFLLSKQCDRSAHKSYKQFVQTWNKQEDSAIWKRLKSFIKK